MKSLPALMIAIMVLVGCKEDQPVEVVQTVEWYKGNDVERVDMVNRCQNNPGEIAATPNCINAKLANDQIIFGSQNFGVKAVPPKFTK